MVIEMPVLDNAIAACGAAFTPLLLALKFGEPGDAARWPAGPAPCRGGRCRSWPRSGSTGSPRIRGRAPRCWAASSTAASPPTTTSAAGFQTPALVIGHPRDPVHPFSDAGMLASELPNGRLVNAHSILELRREARAADRTRSPPSWTSAGTPTTPARRPAQRSPDRPRPAARAVLGVRRRARDHRRKGTPMDYRPLGTSGLQISALTLGTMTFGGQGNFAKVGDTDLAGRAAPDRHVPRRRDQPHRHRRRLLHRSLARRSSARPRSPSATTS